MNTLLFEIEKNKVYLPFNEPYLANSHLLITGRSGTGKSYLLQKLMLEASQQGVSVVAVDFTGGFAGNKLEPFFLKSGRIHEFCAYTQGFPIPLFRRQSIPFSNTLGLEKAGDTAERTADIFSAAFRLGTQQRGLLYDGILRGLRTEASLNLGQLVSILQSCRTSRGTIQPCAASLLGHLAPLADKELFGETAAFDWRPLLYGSGKVTVFQLCGFSDYIQRISTEVLLWDLFYALQRTGSKEHPFILVLDECQCLRLGAGSPALRMLTEGRKFGAALWLATQWLARFPAEERGGLEQAANRIYFQPPDSEVWKIASTLGDKAVWQKRLRSMTIGTCILSGTVCDPRGPYAGNVIVHITPPRKSPE